MAALPDKMSDLLALAARDLRAVEEDSAYRVDMSDWHFPDPYTGQCEVCMAGAVLAVTVGVDPQEEFVPDTMTLDLHKKMLAINSLRMGNVHKASFTLRGTETAREAARLADLDRGMSDYHIDREAFFADVEKLIQDLRQAGL